MTELMKNGHQLSLNQYRDMKVATRDTG